MPKRDIVASSLIASAAERARRSVEASIKLKQRLLHACLSDLLRAAASVTDALRSGGKLLLCGNGGSAADAQHIAAELIGLLSKDRPRNALPAIALTTNTSVLTATANDFGFEQVFARQVEAFGRPGDVLIGISTSGNSKNVILALRLARKRGLKTVALMGAKGAIISSADIAIRVPSLHTQRVQEAHILVGHILCDLVERSL